MTTETKPAGKRLSETDILVNPLDWELFLKRFTNPKNPEWVQTLSSALTYEPWFEPLDNYDTNPKIHLGNSGLVLHFLVKKSLLRMDFKPDGSYRKNRETDHEATQNAQIFAAAFLEFMTKLYSDRQTLEKPPQTLTSTTHIKMLEQRLRLLNHRDDLIVYSDDGNNLDYTHSINLPALKLALDKGELPFFEGVAKRGKALQGKITMINPLLSSKGISDPVTGKELYQF